MDTLKWQFLATFAANIGFILSSGVDSETGPACDWIICHPRKNDETFTCQDSFIFVENVTDFWGTANDVAYQNVRQMCMGARSCDPSRLCGRGQHELLRVRYLCVNVSAMSVNKQCDWPVGNIWMKEGHIQSPNYPAPFYVKTCSWRVTAPEDRYVHISVHDMSSDSAAGLCDVGLNLTYQECATGHVTSRLYCGYLEMNEFIACGSVSVQLATGRRRSGVRFWLSFEVTSSPEAAVRSPLLNFAGQCKQGDKASSRVLSTHVLQRPVLRQLDPTIAMVTTIIPPHTSATTMSSAVTSTQSSGVDRAGLSTTVVIIVASTIGAVLVIAIILAVVFLKRPRVERVEHVYAVPTPVDSTSGGTSGSPTKNETPMLKEYYCAVADAIPSSRLHISPASPGYAEVEDVCKGDNCRWDPHTFTFGPTLYNRPKPTNFPFSETSPNISSFTLSPGKLEGPTHSRTFSDSSHMLSGSPNLNKPVRATRSFRDPKTTDYENIIINEKRPCFIQGDTNYLLQSRLGRVTAAAKTPSQGVQCVQIKPPELPSTEALYATSSVMNQSTPKSADPVVKRHLKNADVSSSGPSVRVLSPVKKSPDFYTRIKTSGNRPDLVTEHEGQTRIPEGQGQRKLLSKGNNSVTSEAPVYENTVVR